MIIKKYSDDFTWGHTLFSMAASVKAEVLLAIQQAPSPEIEEELETLFEGNIGCAILYMGEEQRTYYAYSGIQQPQDRVTLTREFVYLKATRRFETYSVDNENNIADPPTGFDRYFDTESKIMEQIAEETGDNHDIEGELYLFTERYPCQSCESVIRSFQACYKHIQVVVYYEKGSKRRAAMHGIR